MSKTKKLADGEPQTPTPPKRGRRPASQLGKQFEPNTAYIIGRMKRGFGEATQFPEFRPETLKKYYGQQIIDSGASSTHEFFKKNPLDFRCKDPEEFWFIYVDDNGVQTYFDRGQFETIKPPDAAPPADTKLADDEQFRLPSNPGMGDLLNAMIATNKKGGNDAMQQVVIATMQQRIDSLTQELTAVRADYNRVRDDAMNKQIELERIAVSKQLEIDKAVSDAKEAVWNEANAMLDKFKAENAPKSGLSGLFDDPERLTATIDKAVMGLGMLMQLPKVYKELKGVNQPQEQPETAPAPQGQALPYQNGVMQ